MPLNHSLLCPNLKEWAKDNSSWKHTAVQHKEEKEKKTVESGRRVWRWPHLFLHAPWTRAAFHERMDGSAWFETWELKSLVCLREPEGNTVTEWHADLCVHPWLGNKQAAHFRKIDKKEDGRENFSHLSAAIAPGHVGNLAGSRLRPVFCPFSLLH